MWRWCRSNVQRRKQLEERVTGRDWYSTPTAVGRSRWKCRRELPNTDPSPAVCADGDPGHDLLLLISALATALRGIKRLQNSTAFLPPKLPLSRFIRKVANDRARLSGVKWQKSALRALEEVAAALLANKVASEFSLSSTLSMRLVSNVCF